jgi:hypothetical protein
MLQDFQNALYISLDDPSNAVIYDRTWLLNTTRRLGLVIHEIEPPEVRGFQWRLLMARQETGRKEFAFPADLAPKGERRPPVVRFVADRIGLDIPQTELSSEDA